jgi:hypothetical protein
MPLLLVIALFRLKERSMNRQPTFFLISLFFSLTIASFILDDPPLAVAGTLNAPIGLTETFTPTPLDTSVPTETSTPINTPVATNTSAPVGLTETFTPTPMETQIIETSTPMPADTPVPADTPALTETPVPTDMSARSATDIPTAPAVVGLPDTGGAPQSDPALQHRPAPWILMLVALAVGSLGALAFGVRRSLRAAAARSRRL